ncbi:MAG: DUF3010 family protein [Magnetococcales bacterium]|nr:DUF3010 family protein [Magnetococcales bacterium]MBF0115172.1 DUF3010 family protein [Magnetococcales bacterium]
MKVLGLEFASSNLNYVAIIGSSDSYRIETSSRISLGGTRDRDALVAFQDAVNTLLNDVAPDVLAIKEKPETGKMRAGAASLKMEGIILANASCPVVFISGQRLNQTADKAPALVSYLQPALKVAVVAMNQQTE